MFDLNLWRGSSDESRRDVLERLAKLAFGGSVFPLLPRASHAAAKTKSGKAKQVIYLFMNGAMSHLDTFDPKPGAETQGETQPIDTKVMGIQIAEYFPEMASIMDRLAIVRSLSTATGAHEQGQYLMRTSYKPLASIRHPSLSSWVTKIRGRAGSDLPENILVGNSTRHPGAGFLAPNLAPVPIPTARLGLQNTKSPGYLKDSAFKRRMSLSKSFDKSFQARYENQQVDAYNQLYREAIKLLGSDSLAAFDINKESAETLEKYGENNFGQSLLLARRLIEHNVGFVEVSMGGWDDHRELYTNLPDRCRQLDQAYSQLLLDLEASGRLDSTMVVLATEFGRTPVINQNAGRDHHPGAFSSVLAGAGIAGGQVYGSTDEEGYAPEDDPITIQDFTATIVTAMGLDPKHEDVSPSGRPFKMANDGTPIQDLLS